MNLTAKARKVRDSHGELVDVVLLDAEGSTEYEARHYRVTARQDVLAWAARVGVTVTFPKSFPA